MGLSTSDVCDGALKASKQSATLHLFMHDASGLRHMGVGLLLQICAVPDGTEYISPLQNKMHVAVSLGLLGQEFKVVLSLAIGVDFEVIDV